MGTERLRSAVCFIRSSGAFGGFGSGSAVITIAVVGCQADRRVDVGAVGFVGARIANTGERSKTAVVTFAIICVLAAIGSGAWLTTTDRKEKESDK